MTPEKMIEAIVDSMASWEYEELLKWAQDTRRALLDGLDAEQVLEEYQNAVGDRP